VPSVDPRQAYLARVTAELKANALKSEGEASLSEIYECWIAEVNAVQYPIEVLVSIEEDVERRHLVPVKAGIALIRQLRHRHRRVVVVSDTYHSSKFLRDLLGSAGLDVSAEDLFVSCEHGATKRSGDLFDVVARATRCPLDRIHHYGNDYQADVVSARQRGCSASWLRWGNPDELEIALQSEAEPERDSTLLLLGRSYRASRMSAESSTSAVSQEPSATMAVMTVAFAFWLLLTAEEHQLDVLYFMERDMGIVFEVATTLRVAVPGSASLRRIEGGRVLFPPAGNRSSLSGAEELPLHDLYLQEVGATAAKAPGFVDVGWVGRVASAIDSSMARNGASRPRHYFWALDSTAAAFTDHRSIACFSDGRGGSRLPNVYAVVEGLLKSPVGAVVDVRAVEAGVGFVRTENPEPDVVAAVSSYRASVLRIAAHFADSLLRKGHSPEQLQRRESADLWARLVTQVMNPASGIPDLLTAVSHTSEANERSTAPVRLVEPIRVTRLLRRRPTSPDQWFEGSLRVSSLLTRSAFAVRRVAHARYSSRRR